MSPPIAAAWGAIAMLGAGRLPAQSVAITHANVLTMGAAGHVEDGTIIVENGRITAVGRGLAPPAGMAVLDAKGQVAAPGFFLLGGTPSATEFPLDAHYDDSQTNAEFTAGYDMRYAINPNSTYLPEIRRAGSTIALVMPTVTSSRKHRFGYFGGQAALITLAARDDILLGSGLAVTLVMGAEGADMAGGGRPAQIMQLRALFQALQGSRDAKIDGLADEEVKALRAVAAGRIPLITTVHRQSDILAALDLARDFKLHMVLDGAEEGWRVAAEIRKAGVAVLLDTDVGSPPDTQRWGISYANAARLAAAGVPIAIRLGNSGAVFRYPTARYSAAVAVAHGLDHETALAALTSVPATILGIGDRYGSIEPGKQADFVLWTGDPLEIASRPARVFIGGVVQPLVSRQTLLRDRYLAQIRTAAPQPQNQP